MFSLNTTVALSEEHDFFETMVTNEINQSDFSVLIKTNSVILEKDFRKEKSGIGYIKYKFSAEVLNTFKGQLKGHIEYYVIYDSDIEPTISEHAQIVGLCQGKDNKLYVPQNGLRINATDKLIHLANQAVKEDVGSSICYRK